MEKHLFCIKKAVRFLCSTVVLGLLFERADAQCGVSQYPGPGGPFTPSTVFQQTPPTGNDTYFEFNVTSGNIYSFYLSDIGTSSPPVIYAPGTGYNWDMTVSDLSQAINYSTQISPLSNSFTGGACATNNPASTDWYSNYTGTVRISLNSWNGTCQTTFVPGQGSAVIDYKVCNPSPDPGPGIGPNWNVDAFATEDVTIPGSMINARYGYYTDNLSDLEFATNNFYSSAAPPSTAPGWTGCNMPPENWVIRARRQGFPCGIYQFQINNGDDAEAIYLNGTQIFSSTSSVNSPTIVGNTSGYALGANDLVDIREAGTCGNNSIDVSLVPVIISPVDGGTIGGIANNSNVCAGTVVTYFTSSTDASGGTTGFLNGGVLTYDWQLSTDGGLTFTSQGVSTKYWQANLSVPPGATYVIQRVATDECGDQGFSNTITLFGQPAPNGTITPADTTICPGTSATLTLNISPGTAPFNVTYNDGTGNVNLTGIPSGTTVSVSPSSTVTVTYVSITDANGCTTTSGFNGSAIVNVAPQINISSVDVTPVLCFGTSTGTATVNATGGMPVLNYSDDGGVTYRLSNVFDSLAVGTINVYVMDNLGCTVAYAGNPVQITQPTPLTESLTETDASCAGVFDGQIIVTAGGGVGPYTYSANGSPPQPSNVINGLQGNNTYLVTVYDHNGCSDTASIFVGNTYNISVDTISTSNISCYGAGNGSIVLQASGGTAPYMFSISGIVFQASDTFSGLAAGTYIAIARDSKGCTAFIDVNISQPSQLSVTIDSVTNVLCAGSNTGNVYVTVTGGTPGYTYLWSDGNTTQNELNVAGGTYNVTVTDSRGCTAANGATVSSPYLLSLNIALFNNPFCSGDSSGAILLQATGGVPPYNYLWSNAATTQDIDSVPGGSYSATVTDQNGCQQSITQVLTNPTPITSTISATNVACHGEGNGSATVTASGGTPPYTYQWSNFNSSSTITNLSGGTYYVIITDHNGCKQEDSVTVAEPAALSVVDSVSNVSCFNANDGSVNLTVTGGTLPYTYAWSNGSTTQNVSGLPGGPICVTVTDGNNCSVTACYTIINPAQIVDNFVVKNVLCFGDSNGAVHLNVSGGSPAYSFAWSNGATTQDLASVPPACYSVTITDSRGCIAVDSACVTTPAPVTTSGIIKNVSCFGLCDGAVFTTPYGGTVPYSFLWSDSSSTQNVVQLCGGNYYLSVTDANGCQVASLYIIHEPAQLAATISATSPTCYGMCNGSVAAVPTGGTVPYQYLWNDFSSDSLHTGLCGGHYTLLLTDSNGCHLRDTADLITPSQIVITGTVTKVTCSSVSNGAINVSVTGGTGNYTSYVWSGGQTTENITGLSVGYDTLTVTDSHGCTQTAVFYVGQQAALYANASVSPARCAGGNDGFISVDVTGGVVPYTYLWSTTPAQTSATATHLTIGVYTLTVTDSVGCSATVSADVLGPQPVTVTTNVNASRCFNVGSGSVVANVTGGASPYSYVLNGTLQGNNTFTGLGPGNYYLLVMDANGCQGSDSFTITSSPAITVSLTVTDQVILTGMQTQLSANATSDTTIIHYFWSPITVDSVDVFNYSGCSDSSDCSSPYVSPPFTTTFSVSVMNADSCYASDTVTVYVKNEDFAFIPNAFTPNGDGLNDRFEFAILGASTIDISIYNRWGELVFHNPAQMNGTSGTDGWDGTTNGKDDPDGSYVYQMKVTYFSGVVKNKSGTVTIIR